MHSQAHNIMDLFGGAASLAKAINLPYATVYRWQLPKEQGGTDGLVPSKHHLPIIRAARLQDIDIKYSHFFPDLEGE